MFNSKSQKIPCRWFRKQSSWNLPEFPKQVFHLVLVCWIEWDYWREIIQSFDNCNYWGCYGDFGDDIFHCQSITYWETRKSLWWTEFNSFWLQYTSRHQIKTPTRIRSDVQGWTQQVRRVIEGNTFQKIFRVETGGWGS